MASTVCTPTFIISGQGRSTHSSLSNSLVSCSQTRKSCLYPSVPIVGITPFAPWTGLKHLGISITHKSVKIEKCRGKVVYASLFGVGAPEALVIGVVALLVFGPKGLAEVARNLGKTLRAFQPTIRELQEVSREFKSTLEREIGLDEVPQSMQSSNRSNTSVTASISESTPDLNGTPATREPYSSEEYLKTTEEQLKAEAAQQQTPSQGEASEQDDASSPDEPINIGEFLLQAQLRSTAASLQQKQEANLQEAQSETQPQPQPQVAASETESTSPPPAKIED
ncbi:hypothetical protein Syun_013193 [Stephania yunnanensis]|uniref:Sec-independent protein translocase protein TATB, chloroplastic n=1 Tax=Stephania yunnanensis TaxID=152371 RepID=A0AAP0K2B5_9MAGN